MPLSNAKMTLMTPATPLAPSRCPMFDLTDPLQCLRVVLARNGQAELTRIMAARVTYTGEKLSLSLSFRLGLQLGSLILVNRGGTSWSLIK
jgi:hypothetical protein